MFAVTESLGAKVVVEGVETLEEVNCLEEIGFVYGPRIFLGETCANGTARGRVRGAYAHRYSAAS